MRYFEAVKKPNRPPGPIIYDWEQLVAYSALRWTTYLGESVETNHTTLVIMSQETRVHTMSPRRHLIPNTNNKFSPGDQGIYPLFIGLLRLIYSSSGGWRRHIRPSLEKVISVPNRLGKSAWAEKNVSAPQGLRIVLKDDDVPFDTNIIDDFLPRRSEGSASGILTHRDLQGTRQMANNAGRASQQLT